MSYNDQNIFAKILRGEIPCQKVAESQHAFAFRDINPAAPVHVLVIPKGRYVSSDDFTAQASAEEIADFFRLMGAVARQEGLADSGYRIVANHGRDALQEVPHFHLHIIGGAPLKVAFPK